MMAHHKSRKRLPKKIPFRWHDKLPPDLGVNLFLKSTKNLKEISQPYLTREEAEEAEDEEVAYDSDDIVWEPEEIEAITFLFQARIPQKPGCLNRERPLPLPISHKLRPLGFPTPKRGVKQAPPPISKQVYKNPDVLIGLAREIKHLNPVEDVSKVLNKWAPFLRKGSLSMTIRELGHMSLPERALQTFCWAEKQPHLFPDDRILASTVEVLARNHELKVPFDLRKFINMANRSVVEAMVRGFTKGGSLHLAWKILTIVKDDGRMLNPGIYAKLILELGKNPDRDMHVVTLLNELGERDDLNLCQQDCTAIMKVCIKLRKFEVVWSLYSWFKQSGCDLSLVMYTTVIYSRYSEKKYREALALIWEMEASKLVFDLPAYRVVIKLFVSLNDLSRAVRYFSRLKEAGFAPTYDIYKDLINIYVASGRLAKCKEVCKEVEMAGFKLDKEITSKLLQLEREKMIGFQYV